MGLKWIMAAAMLLVATNFVMAAAVRVAVVGEEETVREIRSRLEAEQDIVLAEWKDAPEVSALYDPKIAAYPLPEADFLIVAAKERLVAVLNLRHSYLAAEFSPGRSLSKRRSGFWNAYARPQLRNRADTSGVW